MQSMIPRRHAAHEPQGVPHMAVLYLLYVQVVLYFLIFFKNFFLCFFLACRIYICFVCVTCVICVLCMQSMIRQRHAAHEPHVFNQTQSVSYMAITNNKYKTAMYEKCLTHGCFVFVIRLLCTVYLSFFVVSNLYVLCVCHICLFCVYYMCVVYAGQELIERTPPPRGVFLFTMFPDQEPCVRDFTTRCDGRISS